MPYFRHVYFSKPLKLKERRINNKRHYELLDGSVLPSVTTVLSILSEDGINKWKKNVGVEVANHISKTAMHNGTEFHSMVEDYLNNDPLYKYKNVLPKGLFDQAKPELDKINNIRAQEVQLHSKDVGMAGRVDCVAEYNGVLSIIDFKTATKKKKPEWIEGYFLQCTAYALMFGEIGGIDIEQIVVLISGADGSVETFIRNKNEFTDRLKEVVQMYKDKNKDE